jgi:hypothetical protein
MTYTRAEYSAQFALWKASAHNKGGFNHPGDFLGRRRNETFNAWNRISCGFVHSGACAGNYLQFGELLPPWEEFVHGHSRLASSPKPEFLIRLPLTSRTGIADLVSVTNHSRFSRSQKLEMECRRPVYSQEHLLTKFVSQ